MAMYKYNGWTLPGLPTNWNQVTHPYAVIIRNRASGVVDLFQLLVSKLPFVVKKVDGVQVIAFSCEASIYSSPCGTGVEQWADLSVHELEHAENCQYHYIVASSDDIALSYDWAWCNESIRDDYNNVVYPGSNPILIEEPEPEPGAYDKQSFLAGLAAALCSKARTLYKSENEPIGYLYNGTMLPKLPEWDENIYPYAVICSGKNSPPRQYKLYLCTAMPNELDGLKSFYVKLPAVRYICSVVDETWSEPEQLDENYGNYIESNGTHYLMQGDPYWSNFDFYYTKWQGHVGELYIGKSDPIPVYE